MVRKLVLSAVALLVLAGGGLYLAAQLSPWPKVLLIRHSFDKGAAAASAALEKHVPLDISSRPDLEYAPGDPEARLDVHYPSRLNGTAETLPAIVWVHGGAWVSGDKAQLGNWLKVLAGKGYVAFSVGYSIAPGATYPTPVRQVLAALRYVRENAADLHVDPAHIVIAGDSAGAQIAAQVAAMIASPDYARSVGIETGLPPDSLVGAALFCGPYDLTIPDYDGPFGGFLKTVAWAYSGRKDFLADPNFAMASVTKHVSPGFPPAFVSAGNVDPLLPHSQLLVERLTAAGVPVDTLFFPADHAPPLGHEYQFDLEGAAGGLALERLTAFLARVTAR